MGAHHFAKPMTNDASLLGRITLHILLPYHIWGVTSLSSLVLSSVVSVLFAWNVIGILLHGRFYERRSSLPWRMLMELPKTHPQRAAMISVLCIWGTPSMQVLPLCTKMVHHTHTFRGEYIVHGHNFHQSLL